MSFLLNLEAMHEAASKLKLPCKICGKDLNTGDGKSFLPRLLFHLAMRHPEVPTDDLSRVVLTLLFAPPEFLANAMAAGLNKPDEFSRLQKMGFISKIGKG